jgi:predicted HicB family RNase H-like nuclease
MSSPQEITTHFTTAAGTADSSNAIRNAAHASNYRDDARYSDETLAMNSHSSTSSTQVAAPAAEAASESAQSRTATRLKLSPITPGLPVGERSAEALKLAIEAFPQTDTWVVFYREILGVDGVVRKLFPTVEEMRQWEASAEFCEVHTMLAALRSHDNGKGDTVEPQRMITVRLPVSLHEALKLESEESSLSINKLCITKLLHKMDARFVPQEPGKRRGRKPGPQGKRDKKSVEATT